MKLYAGIDLHSNNITLSILNEEEKEVFCKKIPLDKELILNALSQFKENLQGVVIESTFNWYWLADELSLHGYQVYLAHPPANKQYSGYKHTNDKTDATRFQIISATNIKNYTHFNEKVNLFY